MSDPSESIRPRGVRRDGVLAALLRSAGAGLAASLLAIAYSLSFSALLFHGALAAGLPMGFSALLVGSALVGAYVALGSRIVPAAAGPNNPAVAVLVVLAGSVSSLVMSGGGDAASAVRHVLLAFTFATLLTGVLLYGLGALKLGAYVRFVPYPVIGGFLAASGWLLATGGVTVVTGWSWSMSGVGAGAAGTFPSAAWPQLLAAFGFAGVVYGLKRATGRMNALPVAFLVSTLVFDLLLYGGYIDNAETWFLAGSSEPLAWWPLAGGMGGQIDWAVFAAVAMEMVSAAGVTALALLLDVSALEVARAKSFDLDEEFRINGAANILSAPFGGVMGKLSVNGTRLIDETGGTSRASGLIAALLTGAVAVFHVDLAHLVPAPVLGGLLIFIGLSVLSDVLFRSPARRAWSDYALALLIMAAIIHSGYLAGVILGFVGACLMFALSYSRIGVIRRHLTRRVFASNVDRSAAAMRRLEDEGQRIHLFWLAGYLFFGSAHGLFEAIRRALQSVPLGQRTFAILDLADVSGFDTSALLSLVKLRNLAEERGLTLVFAGAPQTMIAALQRLDLIGAKRPHRTFGDRNAALAWCEDAILSEQTDAGTVAGDSEGSLAVWLGSELGAAAAGRVARYFERRALAVGDVLYREGEAASSIDLIAGGSAVITLERDGGAAHLVRRMAKCSVVGEMGFFRNGRRTATVTAETETVVFTLTREAYRRLIAEEPDAGAAFLDFIIRTLSDRLEFANKGLAALS